MPSPITHLAAGFAIYVVAGQQLKETRDEATSPGASGLLLAAMAASMLPDADTIPGVLFNDFGRYHNNLSHSLAAGLVVAGLATLTARLFRVSELLLFGVVLVAYELHVILDYFTVGRGVMLFWPFTNTRFSAPTAIFYGLHWSEGLFSRRHLLTVGSELGLLFTAFLAVAAMRMGRLYLLRPFRRSSNDRVVEDGPCESD